MIMRKERMNEIWGVLFLLLGLFTLASLLFYQPEDLPFLTSHPNVPVRNYTGIIGACLSFALFVAFGVSAYLIPGLFLLWSLCFFSQKVPEKKFFKFVGLAVALFSTSTIVTLGAAPERRLTQGGAVGYLAGTHLLRYFGVLGSYILAGSCLLLSLLLATDFLIYPLVKKWAGRFQKMIERLFEMVTAIREGIGFLLSKFYPKAPSPRPSPPSVLPAAPLKVKQYRPDLAEPAEEIKISTGTREAKTDGPRSLPDPRGRGGSTPTPGVGEVSGFEGMRAEKETRPCSGERRFDGVIGSKAPKEGECRFPPIDLLTRPEKAVIQQDNLQQNSKILEETLAEFGIEVKVTEVEQGPVITRYELMPAPGVKVNSIAALSDDIALAMKAASVRLIIPIPGKSAVGVEVPNSVTSVVYLRELIESLLFRSKKYALPLALGKDTSGKPLIADLTSMPHILIAGTTGSGKTVCVNSVIAGLLYACSPADLKFVMVDPKRVELAVFNKIPHMLAPVVTDIRKAAQTLNWVVNEMENRYKLFATVGVRNIQSFNSRADAGADPNVGAGLKPAPTETPTEGLVPARLPYIVVVIDELADLMMVAQDKVEGAITRLAQLSRAVGIHLVLVTQRPSVDVITGVIKANFPARISFKVASRVDSRTVLDGAGADKLIGRGDMLFMQPGDAKPVRGQGALVVDEEINRIVHFVAEQARPEYHPEILSVQEGKKGEGPTEKDELFDEAVAIVLETGQASTSNLQRRLSLGYTRAARIIDQMEAECIIGPQHGAKPREIYVSRNPSPETVESP